MGARRIFRRNKGNAGLEHKKNQEEEDKFIPKIEIGDMTNVWQRSSQDK